MFVFSSKQHDTRYFLKLEYYNVNCLHLAICSDINILVNNLEYLACYCLSPLSQILRACLHGVSDRNPHSTSLNPQDPRVTNIRPKKNT